MEILGREVRPIKWKQRRKLHHLHSKAYSLDPGTFNKVAGGELKKEDVPMSALVVDRDVIDEAINMAIDIAFENPEEVFKGVKLIDVDNYGRELLNYYLDPEKKDQGD